MASSDERKGQMFYLSEQTREALKAYTDKNGGTLSAAVETALQRFLAAEAAGHVAETAAPAIEDAVGHRLAEELRLATQPLMAELRAIHREAAIARLETFAHIGNDYGLAEAEKIEAVAERQADGALTRGELARMQVRVSA